MSQKDASLYVSETVTTDASEMSERQRFAIRKVYEIAEGLLSNFPQLVPLMVDDYRNGDTLPTIGERYIPGEFHISEEVTRGAVGLLIRDSLGEDEKKRLASEHNSESGKRILREGKGVFALTFEELSAAGKKGGKIAGAKAFETGTAIFARTHEEMSRTGTENLVRAREAYGPLWRRRGNAYITYSDVTGMTEGEYIMFLSEMEEFRHQIGTSKGKNNIPLIKEEVNLVYGKGRSYNAIASYLSNSKTMPGTRSM